MAQEEQKSGEDLTEEASSYRLDSLREKGQVAQSKELSAILTLAATGYCAVTIIPSFIQQWIHLSKELFSSSPSLDKSLMMKMIFFFFTSAGPIFAAGLIVAILSSFVQVGPLFTLDPLSFDFSRINPLEGSKRLFSKKIGIEALKISIKVLFFCCTVFSLMKTQLFSSGILVWMSFLESSSWVAVKSLELFNACFIVLLAFAGLDFLWVRYEYSLKTRMTKQEAKQEAKEREGNPQIKARIRSVQRHFAKKRMMQAVKKADVIITNPTHVAVAIAYQSAKMKAPVVVAKGIDSLAQRIKEIAKEAQVPCVENVPLARQLYKKVKLGAPIPRNLYQAIAEVLAYVYRLNRKKS
jgi:flagellar biosynthetic protein FlhB